MSFSPQWLATHDQLHSYSRDFLLASEVTEYFHHRGAQDPPGSFFLSSAIPSSDPTHQTTSNIYSLSRVNSQIRLVFPPSSEAEKSLAAQTDSIPLSSLHSWLLEQKLPRTPLSPTGRPKSTPSYCNLLCGALILRASRYHFQKCIRAMGSTSGPLEFRFFHLSGKPSQHEN